MNESRTGILALGLSVGLAGGIYMTYDYLKDQQNEPVPSLEQPATIIATPSTSMTSAPTATETAPPSPTDLPVMSEGTEAAPTNTSATSGTESGTVSGTEVAAPSNEFSTGTARVIGRELLSAECIQEDPKLTGSDLRNCVNEKLAALEKSPTIDHRPTVPVD